MKNSEGETELLLYRAAAAMHKAKFDPEQNLMEEEESFDSPGSLKLSQQEITELVRQCTILCAERITAPYFPDNQSHGKQKGCGLDYSFIHLLPHR